MTPILKLHETTREYQEVYRYIIELMKEDPKKGLALRRSEFIVDVSLDEVARSLSRQCRFNGNIPMFYSVAEHSCVVADKLFDLGGDAELALCGLLHDAAEMFIGDIVTPVKTMCPEIALLENGILFLLLDHFGPHLSEIYLVNEDLIHVVDKHVCRTEKQFFFLYKGTVPRCWNEHRARRNFINDFQKLTK